MLPPCKKKGREAVNTIRQAGAGAPSTRWAFMGALSITKEGRPYLDRLRIVATPLFGVYLHRIHTEDLDRLPHDHPWSFLTLVLSGSYQENVWDAPAESPDAWRARRHPRFSVRKLRRSQAHQVSVVNGVLWTLVLHGPRLQRWGFWRDGVKIRWQDWERGQQERKTEVVVA